MANVVLSNPMKTPCEFSHNTRRYAWHLRMGGYCHFDSPPTNGLHRHGYYECCFVLDGTGTHTHESVVYPLKKGDIFLSKPDVLHEISSWDTQDLQLLFVAFEINRLGDNAAAEPGDGLLEAIFTDKHAMIRTAQHKLMPYLTMLDRNYSSAKAAQCVVEAFFFDCLSCLVGKQACRSERDEPQDQLGRIIRYVETHVSQPIKVAELTRAVGISERSMRRLIQRELGCTLGELVLERRMQYAGPQLLMHFKVEEVAERMGYPYPSQLTRDFKRYYGISPKAYQLKHAGRLKP